MRITFIAMVLSVAVQALAMAQPVVPPERADRASEDVRKMELAKLPLSEAAHRNGGEYVIPAARPDSSRGLRTGGDLNQVGNASEIVVRGKVQAAPAVRLSDNQRSIITYYTVEIAETLKGTGTVFRCR